jgi:hypothetical protein
LVGLIGSRCVLVHEHSIQPFEYILTLRGRCGLYSITQRILHRRYSFKLVRLWFFSTFPLFRPKRSIPILPLLPSQCLPNSHVSKRYSTIRSVLWQGIVWDTAITTG